MIRIAVVEDDQDMARMIREYVNRYADSAGRKVAITSFSDGDEIASDYKLDFDIILMDIQMQFVDGLTAARYVRERNSEVVIIFITNMAQYAIQGYEVNAFDYILKPINYFSFSEKLHRAIERMGRQDTDFLTVSVERGLTRVDISRIRYIESQGHKIMIHTDARTYHTHSITMKALEEKLAAHHFYRCNKGYLVNLEYVEGIEDDCAVIEGEKILISRLKKNMFLETLTDYIGDKVN